MHLHLGVPRPFVDLVFESSNVLYEGADCTEA